MWDKHPVKLKYKTKHRRQIPNPNPKGRKPTVWGGTCNVCNIDFIESELQVDHRYGGAFSLKSIEDLEPFITNIILVTEKDLQLVCKSCNYTLSYAKKYNLSFEQALIYRFAEQLNKDKKLKEFFSDRELTYPGSIIKAKESVIKILETELESNKKE